MPRFTPILDLFERFGETTYGGECVSQAEHALQAARAAERADAPASLVVAALLHDVGHLLPSSLECERAGEDAEHERAGADWLTSWFPVDVTEPIRLHVDAKRYLCATEPSYPASLSLASRSSLAVQGGPMTLEEARAFEALPFAIDAVGLRRWDEIAKVDGAKTPDLAHFARYFDEAAK